MPRYFMAQVANPDPSAATNNVPAPAGPPPDEPVPPPESVTKADSETVDTAMEWSEHAVDLAHRHVFSLSVGIEIAVLLITGLLALALARPGRNFLEHIWTAPEKGFRALRRVLLGLVPILIWALLLWVAAPLLRQSGLDDVIVRAVANLLIAWVLIRLFSTLVPDTFWSNTFAVAAWAIAALNILNLLDPTIAFLDSFAIRLGTARLSLYLVIKGLLFAGLLLWIAGVISRVLNRRISKSAALTPSVQTLLSQTVRLGLLFCAIVIALGTIGFDLTVLTVLSGAIGVGIGFGLQSIFSNLVAGVILLFERSIRVGDFVELADGIHGTVREITIRATLVTTNDNIDVLVPNSEFVNKQMTNWTLRDAYRRLRIPFGVAYGSDKELVRKAGLEAASEVSHTLVGIKGRDPQVWLVGFGDSSLNFELVVWLEPESVKRPAAVNAAYCWAIETALGKHGIEIPFPQRDLHIRSGRLPVLVEEPKR